MEIISEYLPLIMFASVFALLLLGYPVAFTIGGVSLFFGLIGFGTDFFSLLPLRIWGTMTNFTLLAVPLFIVWTHRANVKRLMNGTETRIGAKAT